MASNDPNWEDTSHTLIGIVSLPTRGWISHLRSQSQWFWGGSQNGGARNGTIALYFHCGELLVARVLHWTMNSALEISKKAGQRVFILGIRALVGVGSCLGGSRIRHSSPDCSQSDSSKYKGEHSHRCFEHGCWGQMPLTGHRQP